MTAADDDLFNVFGNWPGEKRAETCAPPCKTGAMPTSETAAEQFANMAVQSTPAVDLPVTAERALVLLDTPKEAPPEQVVAAYVTLNLALTAGEGDVMRQFRKYARLSHPDRAQSSEVLHDSHGFQKLQAAKATVLAWLRGEEVAAAADSDSDASIPGSEGTENDSIRDNTKEENADVGSSDDEQRVEKAWDRVSDKDGDSEVESASADEQGILTESRLMTMSRRDATLVSGSTVLDQATRLSRASERHARVCEECFERPPRANSRLCKSCAHEEAQLLRLLEPAARKRSRTG
jgi:hypothetical protein